jgi:hypothetical protein
MCNYVTECDACPVAVRVAIRRHVVLVYYVYTYIYIYIYIHVCMCVYVCMCIYACMYLCSVYVCEYALLCVIMSQSAMPVQ